MSMKVTYIQHSGFAVEMEDKVLIFDYYRGELPAFGRDRDVYVFVSHKHYDHYQRSIFTWTGKFPRITYILSSDVEEAVPSSAPKDNMYFMEPGETLRIKAGESELLIETLRSTDEGVAFVVKTAGHTIYHAGDLNWWHWEEETDTYNRFMKEAAYRCGLCPSGSKAGQRVLLGAGLVYAPHRHRCCVPHAYAGPVCSVRPSDGGGICPGL